MIKQLLRGLLLVIIYMLFAYIFVEWLLGA
jgi:hypothetical protein